MEKRRRSAVGKAWHACCNMEETSLRPAIPEAAMYAVNLNDLLLTMSASSFLMGLVTFSIGVFILVTRATGTDMTVITQQTAQLVTKGLAEEVAGLIGNTTILLRTMAEMVKTAAGVGVFLTVTGTILMGTSLWIILRIA